MANEVVVAAGSPFTLQYTVVCPMLKSSAKVLFLTVVVARTCVEVDDEIVTTPEDVANEVNVKLPDTSGLGAASKMLKHATKSANTPNISAAFCMVVVLERVRVGVLLGLLADLLFLDFLLFIFLGLLLFFGCFRLAVRAAFFV